MAKVTIETDEIVLTASQVSPAGLAEIVTIIFRESQSDEDTKALKIREDYRACRTHKIAAIIAIRKLFEGTDDVRKGLKEAKDFIEGAL